MLQATNPQNSAKSTSGEYAGLLFRFVPVRNKIYAINFNINYRYNRSKGNDDTQETNFIWHETSASGEIHFNAAQNLKLSLAADYQRLDGEKRDTGNIYQTDTFSESKKQGLRYGFHFILRPTEVIKVEWSNGYNNGVQLYFSRQF